MAATASNPVLAVLASNPHSLLQPTPEFHNAALASAKRYLDPIAQSISHVQSERQRELRKNKKKRNWSEREEDDFQPLRLRTVQVEGFKVDLVHEQARKIFQATEQEITFGVKSLEAALAESYGSVLSEDESAQTGSELEDASGTSEFHSDAEDLDLEEEYENEEDMVDYNEAEDGAEDEDIESDSEGFEDMNSGGTEDEEPSGTYVEDRHGLNDGFFSIDDFNKQTDFLEQVDARGDPDDGAASDEEEVDWDADPQTLNIRQMDIRKEKRSGDRGDTGDDDDDDDDSEGGPTFGDMDLNGPEGFSDDEDEELIEEDVDMDGIDDTGNANNIMYKDFFAPPPRKGGKCAGKHGPPMAHNFPTSSAKPAQEDAEEHLSRTMAAVHRDLFSDEEEGESDGDLSEIERGDGRTHKSNHERRQAKLIEEIRRLEAENVAKREWTMSGEARAIDRPKNSLLEEDLDFERVGKPVPVITQEITEDIEALIKRRILAREFDEVLRRRPDELLSGPIGRRGRVDEELQDTKSKQGLADLYEDEHLRRIDPNYVDARDEKLKAAHREIEVLWRDVCDKLDSLCSWHYRPKPVEMSVQVRSDAPLISMEDARPSGIGGDEMGETTQLAPQEVYKAGQDKTANEVVTKGGQVIARDELSREDKKARRARNKERSKKAGEGNKKPVANGQKARPPKGVKINQVRNPLAKDLKTGGVMVIGRKGEVVDVEGKQVKGRNIASAGALKL